MYRLRVKSLALDNQLIKALPPNRLRALKIFWFPPSRGKGYGMSGGEGCLGLKVNFLSLDQGYIKL